MNTNTLFLQLTDGCTFFGDFEILYNFSNVNTIVELGTSGGLSTLMLSLRGAKVFTIDLFEKYELIPTESQRILYREWYKTRHYTFDIINKYLKACNKNIEVIQGLSFDVAKQFKDSSIDLLFIDADHSYQGVKKDYYSWFNKIKKNGVILLHDYNLMHPEIMQFFDTDIQNEIKNNKVRLIDYKTENMTIIKVLQKI